MKKILLSITVLGASLAANSQILYNQLSPEDTNGIISNQYSDASADTTIVTADDFVVPTGGTWSVTGVTIAGFRNASGGATVDMTSLRVMIMQDAAGSPGSSIADETFAVVIPEPADTAITFTFASPVALTEGTYWITGIGVSPAASRWNWSFVTTGSPIGATAMLIDEDNWFGAGATSWTAITSLGLTQTDMAFSINGTGTMVGIDDNETVSISVYPNPAVDNLTIVSNSNEVIEKVQIFNTSGQVVYSEITPTNTLDISLLSSGIYVVEVTTENGTIQEKVTVK